MKKLNMSKDMMNEMVGTAIVSLFGLCVIIGWFKDVILRTFNYFDWISEGAVAWVLAILVALAAIVFMLAAIAGAVLDVVFKIKGKAVPLYTYIQGGGAVLAFLSSVVGYTFVNMIANLFLGNDLFDTWFSAGSLIWVILVICVVKFVYLFMFKEDKMETADDLAPLE